MTPLSTALAAAAAGAALLLIHALYRGARRSIEVATLKPFDADSRPRLTLAPLTERVLLSLRLALVAVAFAIVAFAWPSAARDGVSGGVLAVVPGTPVPAPGGAARRIWLDGEDTPVSAAPRRDDVAGGALLSLAQRMRADDALVVSGGLPATAWPIESPRFGRAITWRGGPLPDGPAAGWAAAGAPGRLLILGDDARLAAAVTAAVATWRAAGLLPERVTLSRSGSADPDAAVITLGDGPPPQRRWSARVVATPAGVADDARVVGFDPLAGDGAFATTLWHALTGDAGREPVPDARVVPEPSGPAFEPVVAGRVSAAAVEPTSPLLLWLLVTIFALERFMAVRGAQ